MTDPIADLLTRIRNALKARHAEVAVPHSNLKHEIVRILYQEGLVTGYRLAESEEGEGHGKVICIALKYAKDKQPVIERLRRYSRPGLRTYVGYKELRPVRNGMGLMILSTPKGVLTDTQARQQKVGGEALCTIW